jgi:hypothetical protein
LNSNRRGDSEFGLFLTRDGQAVAMKDGAAYLNVWMEVVRYLNGAVVKCRAIDLTAAAAVDRAVAYYAGSRTTEENSEGVLLYELAEIRALQMKTNGKDIDDSYVNVDILRHLKSMQKNLVAGNASLCDNVEASKVHIVTMMKVPIVQSILRYAYIKEKEPPSSQEQLDKISAEGATFSACILPFVHQCDARAAEIVHAQMKLGVIGKYDEVKRSMESTYACLNITCEYVGGIWDNTSQSFKSLPCRSAAGRFGMSVGIISAVVTAAYLLV